MSQTSPSGDSSHQGILIVVMGTSGTGKSTLGMSLSKHFNVPFIDGDDLHPPSNVAKMSAGNPLDDDDRLPWLLRIRNAAFELTEDRSSASNIIRESDHRREEEAGRQGKEDRKQEIRRMAEVLETSKQPDAEDPSRTSIQDKREDAETSKIQDEGHEVESQDCGKKPSPAPRRACIIACSALKRKYRDLLRSHQGYDTYPTTDDISHLRGRCLDVYFLYIQVPEKELIRRMHERKAHFMKESMLRSQLQTLEEPDPENEPGILVLDGLGSKNEVDLRAEALITDRVFPLNGSRI
ncbi:hypothetical protein CF326_g6162 [Tilletia indica]|nr:hypothetical protein CF326_g6162 [Tilletia indica]